MYSLTKNRYPLATARFESLKPEQLVMPAITYGESHHAADKSSQRERTLLYLARLIQNVPVESISPDTAQGYGEIRAISERQVRVPGNNDLGIAAHAVTLVVTLATNHERDFDRILGLTVETWTK